MLPENSVVISNGHWVHLFDIDSLLYVDFAQGIHGANPVSEYSPGPHLSSNNTKKKKPYICVWFHVYLDPQCLIIMI